MTTNDDGFEIDCACDYDASLPPFLSPLSLSLSPSLSLSLFSPLLLPSPLSPLYRSGRFSLSVFVKLSGSMSRSQTVVDVPDGLGGCG